MATQIIMIVLIVLVLSFTVAYGMGWIDKVLPPTGKTRTRLGYLSMGTVG